MLWLQRSPVVLTAFSKLAPKLYQTASARLLTGAGLVQAAGTHAVTGATASIVPLSTFLNPAEADLGESFAWAFRTDGGKSESYEIQDLPEGLAFTNTRGIGSITGIPTEHGDFFIRITGWERANQRGAATDTYLLRLKIRPSEGHGGYEHWATASQLPSDLASPEADPDVDGSNNLVEYAFGFDPLKPNPAFGPNAGSAPISTPEIVHASANTLQVAHIERRSNAGSEVEYVLETSSNLSDWTPVDGQRSVSNLDADWQGVITEIPKADGVRFLRLRLALQSES